MFTSKFLATLKAWAGLVGSIVTAVLATTTPDSPLYVGLTIVAAVATGILVYAVPNDLGQRKGLE